MKAYHLESSVTISLHTVVHANSEQEAIEIARKRDLVEVRSTYLDDPEEVWCTSGELDGEIQKITVDSIEEAIEE